MHDIRIRIYTIPQSHVCDLIKKRHLAEKEVLGIIYVFLSGDYKPEFITLVGSANKNNQ